MSSCQGRLLFGRNPIWMFPSSTKLSGRPSPFSSTPCSFGSTRPMMRMSRGTRCLHPSMLARESLRYDLGVCLHEGKLRKTLRSLLLPIARRGLQQCGVKLHEMRLMPTWLMQVLRHSQSRLCCQVSEHRQVVLQWQDQPLGCLHCTSLGECFGRIGEGGHEAIVAIPQQNPSPFIASSHPSLTYNPSGGWLDRGGGP